ncbi:MAG: NAD(+)/NADH kinase [Acidimicrobiales bacterium]
MTVGFVLHSRRPEAARLCAEVTSWLRDLGHQARPLDTESPNPWTDNDFAGAHRHALEGVDLAVSLGGDGTMLRAVDLVAPAGIPVLGVNLGHLGYLTTVEPGDLCHALERFLAGDYRVESRMTIDVRIRSLATGAERLRRSALNDLVLTRPTGYHTVHAAMSVSGTPFLTFAADSLIVASPTGSTAYNLSARGPIASPRTRVQIVTPVAPHMLFDRSLVLAADEEIGLQVIDERPADLVVDGWSTGRLAPGELVVCTGGRRDAFLVTFSDRDFHRVLKHKFNLPDR